MPAILCVFAHPDDEAFGIGGTIARYAAQGVPIDLLTFTPGQRGTAHEPPIDTPEAIGRLRSYELRAAVRVLGVRELTLLEYMDGELDRADTDELAGHVLAALQRSGADTIITFGPKGITRHGDHIATHHAVLRAVERARPAPRVFYGAVPEEFAKEFQIDGPETEPTHALDVSAFFEIKLAGLACHSSQQDTREFFTMMADRRLTQELYHQALPPYEDSGMARDLFE